MQLNIRAGCRIPPHRSGCGGDIGTDSEFIVKELLQSPAPTEHQDDIRRGAAPLETETPTAHGQKYGGAPALGGAANYQTLSVVPADKKGKLLFGRYNANALSGVQQVLGNSPVGRSHDLLKNLSGFLDAVDVVSSV